MAKKTQKTIQYETPPDLDAEDEAILDSVWAEVLPPDPPANDSVLAIEASWRASGLSEEEIQAKGAELRKLVQDGHAKK